MATVGEVSRSLKLSLEISVPYGLCLVFRPGFHAHLLYQAEVKHLDIMGPLRRFIGTRLVMVTRNLGTFETKINALSNRTCIFNAWFVPANAGYYTFFITATIAESLLKRHIHHLSHSGSKLFIGFRHIHRTVKTIQSAWRC